MVFLPRRLTATNRAALDDLLAWGAEQEAESLILVSSVRVHLQDPDAAEVEAHAFNQAKGLRPRTVIIRAGHILSPHSRVTAGLRRFGAWFPLVPRRLRSCCVVGDELFALIEAVRTTPRSRRVYTLLGPNRPWRDLLAEHRTSGFPGVVLSAMAAVLSLLQIGNLAALVLNLWARCQQAWRAWNFDTLQPRSLRELIALANPFNRRHIKVVGYNNGINHFGQRYPGQTVVSTVRCAGVRRTGPETIAAGAGVTVRKALDYLAASSQEMYVIPNYSYVCLGTAFFVPIHGSAADFSTIADTITEAILYDPASDRILRTRREEPAFRETLYNLKSDVVVLQLGLRVKPKTRYFIHKEEVPGPTADNILGILRDPTACNVEVRQACTGAATVQVSRFYNNPGDTTGPVLELPRDRLGRLWDQLEENPVTSFLMHALTRHFAFHVELFFSDEQFGTFWETCRSLPLRKIQLRNVRRDGFPCSPFRDHDCVSADLFMFRWNRRRFLAYLKQTLPGVRSNPGKQSL